MVVHWVLAETRYTDRLLNFIAVIMSDSIRLSKRIAELVPCSRREAEQYIEGGWVRVDGMVIEEQGFRVLPEQLVELMPQADLATIEPVTILFHKPAGIEFDADSVKKMIMLENRSVEDRAGISFLKRHLVGQSNCVPLDAATSGLMVLTQDWRIARKLIDDISRVEQEYIVEVAGTLAPEGLKLLNHGLVLNGRALLPVKVSWQNENRLRFAIKAPQHDQIARMCKMVGLKVLSIKRIRIGRVPMSSLQVGQWRFFVQYERF